MSVRIDQKAEVWRIVHDHFAQAAAPGVVAVYVYGSAGRSRRPFQPHSDVDVAVLFPWGRRPRNPLDWCLREAGALEARLGRETEVILLNEAPLLLAYEVLKHGVRVLESVRTLCRRMEAGLLSAYWDYLPVREIVTRGMTRRLFGAAHG